MIVSIPLTDTTIHRLAFIQTPLPLKNPRYQPVECRGDANYSYLCDPQQIMVMEFILNAPTPVQYVKWNWAYRGGVWEIYKTLYNPLIDDLAGNGNISSTQGEKPMKMSASNNVGSLFESNTIFRYSDAIQKEQLVPKFQVIFELWFRCRRGVNGMFPQRFVFQSWGCEWSGDYK